MASLRACLGVYDYIYSFIKYLISTRMAKKHIGRCSTLLTVKEMHSKTTVRDHFTPTRV